MSQQQPEWVLPPKAPTDITINGKPESAGLATKSTGSVDIGYNIMAPLRTGYYSKIRVIFVVSKDDFATSTTFKAQWYHKGPIIVPPDERFHFIIRGLSQNTLYRVRAYTDAPNFPPVNFNAFSFWTNRPPNLPELVTPTENQAFLTSANIIFDWKFTDPDPNEDQVAYQLRWREVRDDSPIGAWETVSGGAATTRTVAGSNFQGNRHYEWQVRLNDGSLYSEWSLTRSFYMKAAHSPPQLLTPIKDTAIDVTVPVQFIWRFRDPESGDTQHHADLRWRVVGGADWNVIAGAVVGADNYYTMAANTLIPGYRYEWQVQTYDVGSGGGIASDWSEIQRFYGIATPGRLAEVTPILDPTVIKGELGCGDNRVFVYQQGGQVPVGEITGLARVIWKRQRDDISTCLVDTSGFDTDCGDLLKMLRCWQYELVIFRDGVRVWEGPITRLEYTADNVEIEAGDVMRYVYRRIMRQGYNDSYNCLVKNAAGDCIVQAGLNTIVYRAARIITDALGRGDPNVLPYLTAINNPGDARQSRIVPDYSKTAWEEVDDLASNAGLDYVTVGRRIILFDTHYPIGRLPEMRDGDFTDPVIVSEYGMNTCNYYGVTDGSGVWGASYPLGRVQTDYDEFYGPIELLSSSYGDSTTDEDTSTPSAVQRLRQQYSEQAQRNISNRWPTPVVVRVPDNTSIKPEVNIDINYLVPGVWVPVRSTAALREVSQWQKLDSVTVTQTDRGETVQVVMSPAPHGGNDDPDAEDGGGET